MTDHDRPDHEDQLPESVPARLGGHLRGLARLDLGGQLRLALHLGRWIVLGAASGVLAGFASAGFLESLDWATRTREHHSWLLFLLPLAGLATGLAYHYGAGRAVGMNKPDWGRYTKNGNTVYAHVYERPTGPILFENLGAGADGVAKVKRARYLADGSELIINKPWNVPQNSPHLFVNLPRTPLPDAVDTVIALELT